MKASIPGMRRALQASARRLALASKGICRHPNLRTGRKVAQTWLALNGLRFYSSPRVTSALPKSAAMATESSDSTSSDSEMPPGTTYELTRDNGETFELSFVEEPLGIGKDVGYGYVDLQFGERIGPEGRYEILRKLGYGRSSSVWLARDHEPRPEKSRFVAIKCYTGHVTDLSRKLIYFEDIIMSTIESRDLPTGLDAKHCLEILDVFGHEGGSLNAEHQCIVTEVMGGDAAALREVAAVTESKAMSLRMAKRLLLHTLKSLTMLHSQSIVHTGATQPCTSGVPY